MTSLIASDVDDTARLILMEIVESPGCPSLIDFHARLRDELGQHCTSAAVSLWSKYMGMDGRSRPTHDLYTGRPIR